MNRTCDDCQACCEGWLKTVAYDHVVDLGKPCFFITPNKRCGVYSSRPAVCRAYNCDWKQNKDFPEWMKPSKCGVLVDDLGDNRNNRINFVRVVQCAEKVEDEVFNFISQYAKYLKKDIYFRSPFKSAKKYVKLLQQLGCTVSVEKNDGPDNRNET